MRKRALSLLLSGLLCLATQLSASGDDQAACAAGSPAAQQADAAAPTCASLEARLAATGLHAMHGLQPDGPEHCRVVVRDQWARELGGAEASPLHWNMTLRVSKPVLASVLGGADASGALWHMVARDPLTAGIQLTNLLCVPRIAMLWHAIKEARVMAARSGDAGLLQLFRPSAGAAQRAAQERVVRDQLAALQLQQHLLSASHSGRDLRHALPTGLRAAGLEPNEQLLLDSGSPWAWLLWLCCPSLLVAHWTVVNASGHPWFALYISGLGLMRTCFEIFAVRMALSKGRLSRSDKLDSFLCSHILPAALNGALAGLQALMAPYMPHVMAQAVFWLRVLLLPPVTMWVMFSSWLPLEDEPAGGMIIVRNGSRSGGRRLELGDPVVPGAAGAAAPAARPAVTMHWPPALHIPPDVDDLPPEQVPEAFRCPITLGIMHEPTQSTSGITFERLAITQWLEAHRHDPVTHAPLRRRHLSPNLCLRAIMQDWIDEKAAHMGQACNGKAAGSVKHK